MQNANPSRRSTAVTGTNTPPSGCGIPDRRAAADRCLEVLDTELFRALCEPARVEVIRRLIVVGRADIAAIADGMPQDRSVVSRHLQVLERAGIVQSAREGRQVFYELDGPAILGKFGALTAALAPLVPLCCPGAGPSMQARAASD